MKFSVCTLFTSPLHLLHNRHPAQFRKICSHAQKHSLHTKEDMVAGRYFPPWFSIAPMMDCTDNHYRTVARLMSKHAWVWTEMIAAETIVYQEHNLDRFLAYSPDQHPIMLQIGGNNLDNLAKATRLVNAYGYDEINLNCGCPSAKVAGHGCFGARLMLNPKFVGEAMSVIAANCDVPVSVKCRIGVDDHDSYEELCDFIYTVASQSPTRHFIIHSRKAMLNGISPADKRKIPPLKYEYFFSLLRDFPDLRLTINGGITHIDEVNNALRLGAHGVMIGRACYSNPWSVLGPVDSAVYGVPGTGLSRRQILERYQVYADNVLEKVVFSLCKTFSPTIYSDSEAWLVLYEPSSDEPNLIRTQAPLLAFFFAEPGNGLWKRKADAAMQKCTTMKSLLEETLDALPDSVLDALPSEISPLEEDIFAGVHDLLLPPYNSIEEIILCA